MESQAQLIRELGQAAAKREAADAALRDAVRRADKAGVPIAAIARAVGVTRPTVYKMLEER